ncbi:glycoside hydrolase family 2 TIM barrel-domain containing protein [Terriglobus aquaticus]|uniref:Glycoside hydrolase family 2 TIM barrel-domain containing protein n=1 Tax=Terriglobus aquaticus TaxID=940139 RepID=A0ABW9KP45_9BACT|nr:glycoside hydrolase family 2 TIM barrel-domain containing protein [Terriglobus aquaticus]
MRHFLQQHRNWILRGIGPAACVLLALPCKADAKRSPDSCSARAITFDGDWRFQRGDQDGAEQPGYTDAAWQTVATPHDWAIAGPFDAANPSRGQGAFAPMGVGWYRKHFSLPLGCGTHAVVQFDGVMANSTVWINGHQLGHRPSGYSSFRYDMTEWLHKDAGADNVIAVRADNAQQPSSRFYQGAGIYRHVHLFVLPAMHITGWSTVVRTTALSADSATLTVEAGTHNEADRPVVARARITLLDPDGRVAAQAFAGDSTPVPVGGSPVLSATLTVAHPQRWDLAHPALYRARFDLLDGDRVIQMEEVPFGIRDAHFEAATGFWLNGRNLKIKGVALHSDVGALGVAAPLSLWEHRLRAMQSMGVNAIRTAHNVVAPEFLDLCDRLGLLVLDEYFDVWTVAKNPFDYHLYFRDWYLRDTRDGVRRDRNHPSIIAWSAGNEIHDTPHPEIALPILKSLVEEYHRADPTRPVTQALFRPNVSHDYQDGLADLLDVVGQNYRPNEILAAHADKPSRKILGTENIHDRATWLAVRDNPPYSGMFVWAGTDYLGESRRWPLIGDSEGLFDRTDWPKPDALEHESWWAEHPVVHVVRRIAPQPLAPTDPGYEAEQYRPRQVVFADWSPRDRSPHTEAVEVYSNCASVSLLLNGKMLETPKPLPADAAPRTWSVPFAPGTLTARCVDTAGTLDTLRTANVPARLRLTLETPPPGTGFDQVAIVRVTVVDRNGTPVPEAALPLHFSVEGAATLLATDNADNVYSGPFPQPDRATLDGRAVAFVRRSAATGRARLLVQASGLPVAVLNLGALGPH